MSGLPTYPDCGDLTRPIPILTVDKHVADVIANDFRVLPIFEKTMYECNYKKYYSLDTNEFLKCRWRSYVKHFEERTFAPFEFIDIRDFHFYNGRNRLLPSESLHRKKEFRYKLKVGPGVDFCGQIPIPQDLLMKRSNKPIPKPRRHTKPENKNVDKYVKEGKNKDTKKK